MFSLTSLKVYSESLPMMQRSIKQQTKATFSKMIFKILIHGPTYGSWIINKCSVMHYGRDNRDNHSYKMNSETLKVVCMKKMIWELFSKMTSNLTNISQTKSQYYVGTDH